jgi:hypothetical protein
MNKAERKKRYEQIAKLAEWVNEDRQKVAEDGMSIIIAIADKEKIRRMCLTGGVAELYVMLDTLRQGAANEFDRLFGEEKKC